MDDWEKVMVAVFRDEDADPGHVICARAPLPRRHRYRLTLAWLTFYHMGVAGHLSACRGSKFWDAMEEVYDVVPRQTERRHFRGKAGRAAIAQWRSRYPKPEDMIEDMLAQPPSYMAMRKHLKDVLWFGDYFIVKACDIYESLTGRVMDTEGLIEHLPPSPTDGAELIGKPYRLDVGGTLRMIVHRARKHKLTAPPRHDHPFGLLEAETVCCVWTQVLHDGGHVPGMRKLSLLYDIDTLPSLTGKVARQTLLDPSPYSWSDLKRSYRKLAGRPYSEAIALGREQWAHAQRALEKACG